MDDGLDDHGGGVDPGQRHEQGERPGYGDNKSKYTYIYDILYG